MTKSLFEFAYYLLVFVKTYKFSLRLASLLMS
jgi:hypothetical protein